MMFVHFANSTQQGTRMLPENTLPTRLTNKEISAISIALEQHNAVFHKFWQIGLPSFSNRIPTAAVYFNKVGDCVAFEVNAKFWSELDFQHKLFVISHECLHVILNHGLRACNIPNPDRAILNIAMDICVNYGLNHRFGFDRDTIDPECKYIYHDKIFTAEKFPEGVPVNKNFEFYYDFILRNRDKLSDYLGKYGVTVDDHDGFFNIRPEDIEKIMDKFNEFTTEEEKKNIKDFLESQNPVRGDGEGHRVKYLNLKKPQKNKKWESVIQNYVKKKIKYSDIDTDQWVGRHRRFTALPENMIFPNNKVVTKRSKISDKIVLHFFLDTSGSCIGFAERFFKAAMSIPPEQFEIKLFCFDTEVYPTTLESQAVYGGGGTSFDILEDYIQKEMTETESKYPDAVFVLSDGYGNKIKPQMPEKWHWFLTDNYRDCIPKKCNFHMLKDFD